MAVHYVFNTSGEYVAFAQAGELFTPACEWLGPVRGHEAFNTQGEFVGLLRPDRRIARDRSSKLPRQILNPRSPMRPMRPLRPKRGLLLPALPDPLEDVFEGLPRPLTALVSLHRLEELNRLPGCLLVANDGAALGRNARDPADAGSLARRDGPYGHPASGSSIFNESSPYGSVADPRSPFHPASTTPPQIRYDGEFVAYLSANVALPHRVDPDELVAWIARR